MLLSVKKWLSELFKMEGDVFIVKTQKAPQKPQK